MVTSGMIYFIFIWYHNDLPECVLSNARFIFIILNFRYAFKNRTCMSSFSMTEKSIVMWVVLTFRSQSQQVNCSTRPFLLEVAYWKRASQWIPMWATSATHCCVTKSLITWFTNTNMKLRDLAWMYTWMNRRFSRDEWTKLDHAFWTEQNQWITNSFPVPDSNQSLRSPVTLLALVFHRWHPYIQVMKYPLLLIKIIR